MSRRRKYTDEQYRDVLLSHEGGMGYRRIRMATGIPESTIRDWVKGWTRNGAEAYRTIRQREEKSQRGTTLDSIIDAFLGRAA